MRPREFGGVRAEAGEVKKGFIRVFRLAGGPRADIPCVLVNGTKAGPVVNVHAGIHGDEFEGIDASWRLSRMLSPKSLSGTVIVTPIVHLAAYGAGMRESPVDGKNLARVFPGDLQGTATEKIARVFFNEVVLNCDYVIGLHSGGYRNRFHPLIEYYEGFDPAVGEKARAAAEAFCIGPFDIMQRIGNPPTNVTCTSEASRHGVPGVEGEMWGEGRCVDEHAEQYAESVLSVLAHLGMVSGDSGPHPERSRRRVRHCEGEWMKAANGGFFSPEVGLEDRVTSEQVLGVVRDELGETVERVIAHSAGFVAALRTFPMVRPGDGTVMVERELR